MDGLCIATSGQFIYPTIWLEGVSNQDLSRAALSDQEVVKKKPRKRSHVSAKIPGLHFSELKFLYATKLPPTDFRDQLPRSRPRPPPRYLRRKHLSTRPG